MKGEKSPFGPILGAFQCTPHFRWEGLSPFVELSAPRAVDASTGAPTDHNCPSSEVVRQVMSM